MVESPPSTPALSAHLARLGVTLPVGARGEIGLAAVDWTRVAARRLRRGFLLLIDYGHEARELYSASHAGGTLTTFAEHRAAGAEAATPDWLDDPGGRDITAHVDFTSVRDAAEAEGCTTIGFLDQTYFLMGLVDLARLDSPERRRAFTTLIMPGGLGSTMKVLILGKNVGTPRLRGCASGMRVT